MHPGCGARYLFCAGAGWQAHAAEPANVRASRIRVRTRPAPARSLDSATALHKHWTPIFQPKPVDTNKATRMLAAFSMRLPEDADRSVTYGQFLRAINRMHPNAAPGPDGLSVAFWQAAPQKLKMALYNITKQFANGLHTQPGHLVLHARVSSQCRAPPAHAACADYHV